MKEDFQDLGTALSSGSLTDAQTAYNTLQSDGSSQANNSSNPMSQDLQALGSALQSGSLEDAQQAFDTIQKHMKGHGDFARQQLEMQQAMMATSTDSSNQSNSTNSSDSSGGDTLQKDFQALSSALSSGSLSDAQQAYATLQSDLSSQSGSTTGLGGGHHHHWYSGASSSEVTATAIDSTSSTTGIGQYS